MRVAAIAFFSFCFVSAGTSHGRSLDLFDSYSLSAHGGLHDLQTYNAGLQAMTLDGPGDSSWLMFHMGYGLDLGYAHDGRGLHHLRVIPAVELFVFFVYLQVGLGTFVDLEDASRWGLDLMGNFGLRLFLGDEYQAPSISVGGRLDYLWAKDYGQFVPSAMAMVSFTID